MAIRSCIANGDVYSFANENIEDFQISYAQPLKREL